MTVALVSDGAAATVLSAAPDLVRGAGWTLVWLLLAVLMSLVKK